MIAQAHFFKPVHAQQDFEVSHWGNVLRRVAGVAEHVEGDGAVVPEGDGFWLIPRKYLAAFEAAWLAKYPPAEKED